MAEYFHLVAPRNRMAYPYRSELRRMIFRRGFTNLVNLLVIPVRPQSPSSSSSPSTSEVQQTGPRDDNYNPATFPNLPAELHYMVLGHIKSIEDIVCLGLTNPYFWSLVQGALHDHYMSCFGKWAGRRIAFLGDKVLPSDYPAGLLPSHKLYQLWLLKVKLSHFSDANLSDFVSFADPTEEAEHIISHCKFRERSKDPVFLARCQQVYPDTQVYFPKDQPWILRNLTTKEFVRSEAIAIKPECINGPFIKDIGFEEVIAIRTCLSSTETDILINKETNTPKGLWAGHRFDITTLARHESGHRGIKSTGWTDVSDEVAKQLAEVWKHEFGVDIKDVETWKKMAKEYRTARFST